ncbi:MAG: molybdate ABC transporter substrate-binding protein [Polyangiales bacterium]|nr:molybdate ABC transporter substrate-binding protein [Myxococcales bacterium]
MLRAHLSSAALSAAFLLGTGAACGNRATDGDTVHVFAASSLARFLDAYAKHADGHAPTFTTQVDASSRLARSIDAGANADVMISADEEWIDWLDKRGHLEPGTRVPFATNRLVIVFAEASKRRAEDLLDVERIAMPDDHVPLGRYGHDALVKYGLWERVRGRVVTTENAQATFAWFERREVGAAIVYATDARKLTNAGSVTVPESFHTPVRYTGAVLKDAKHKEAAKKWLHALTLERARTILRDEGFEVPRGN